ncbi:PREDICTED: psbP domain-containing protein 3, chloroplastic isoform X2 [Ipomoea nil]|uniref:psbP domain-containing protein 3, chloroplastic isoform X2 n=1 Tax=Ipomoea nil TaxID=35883 RepID=UPI0009012187|nr:PREDICTED: psbP domain-containing protein 3, chloroplastic isoform X2 [Ipomoea nil]
MATSSLSSSLLHSQCGSFLATAVSRSATRLHTKSLKNTVNSYISCCNNPGSEGNTRKQSLSKRRELLLQAGLVAFSLSAFPSVAFADNVKESPRVYSDDVNKFKISIPADWEVGTGEGDGVRSLIAFYPQEASNSNVSIVITSLGADFTRLESFGKVDEFAENLVSGLDRSWKRPPGVAAKLINSKSANGLYYIDYTLQNPGQSLRRLFTVLGIANNGYYNRLYTITGQFVEEEAEKYGAEVEKVNLFCFLDLLGIMKCL